MKSLRLELAGKKYGKWTILSFYGRHGHSCKWLCRCDCGNEKAVNGYAVRTGQSKQCTDCNRKELPSRLLKAKDVWVKNSFLKHGNGISAKKKLIGRYKANANSRSRNFELTKEDFFSITSSDCHYCGQKPIMIIGSGQKSCGWPNGTYTYNGIDRINNDIGYTKENCVPCCNICNKAKRDMSYEDFSSWIKRLTSNFGEKKCL